MGGRGAAGAWSGGKGGVSRGGTAVVSGAVKRGMGSWQVVGRAGPGAWPLMAMRRAAEMGSRQ
ncbi:hypothetical protein VM98_34815, partial [Streptomyces rubellomurinus subsp. indigoferus]